MNIFMTQRMIHHPEGGPKGCRENVGGLYILGRDMSAVSYDQDAKLCRVHMANGETFLVAQSLGEVIEWWGKYVTEADGGGRAT